MTEREVNGRLMRRTVDSIKAGTAAGTLNVEMTAGSSSNPDYYTLPLGSSALDDGLLVLKTLRRQLDDQNHYRMIPADSIFRSCNDSSSSAVVLPVTMEIVTSSQSLSGIGAQLFQWSWPPTPSVRTISLCHFLPVEFPAVKSPQNKKKKIKKNKREEN